MTRHAIAHLALARPEYGNNPIKYLVLIHHHVRPCRGMPHLHARAQPLSATRRCDISVKRWPGPILRTGIPPPRQALHPQGHRVKTNGSAKEESRGRFFPMENPLPRTCLSAGFRPETRSGHGHLESMPAGEAYNPTLPRSSTRSTKLGRADQISRAGMAVSAIAQAEAVVRRGEESSPPVGAQGGMFIADVPLVHPRRTTRRGFSVLTPQTPPRRRSRR